MKPQECGGKFSTGRVEIFIVSSGIEEPTDKVYTCRVVRRIAPATAGWFN